MPDPEALVAEIDRRFASGESHRYTLEEMRLYMKSERCKRARRVLEELGKRASRPSNLREDLPRDVAWVSVIPVGL